MDLVIKLDWEDDGRNNLAILRLFVLILFFFFFTNEIDFLFHFLGQSFILNRITSSLRAIPPKMISKSLATTKASLMLGQERPVTVRKRFELRRLSKGSCGVLLPITGTSGTRGLARRRITMIIGRRGSGTIVTRGRGSRAIVTGSRRSRAIITRQQCFYNAHCTNDEG